MDPEVLKPGQGWEPTSERIKALRGFLEREHHAQHSGREAAYEQPVEDRVKSGLAIDQVFFAGTQRQGNRTFHVFHARRNDSRFRPGARLRLSRGDPRQASALLELVDDRYDGKKYELRLSGEVEEGVSLESSEPWVLDEDVFDLLDSQLSFLREAEESGLAAWLDGAEDSSSKAPAGDSLFRDGLSASAQDAFDAAASSQNWAAVQGPPGTGKTHLLARLALHAAVERGEKVLVTAVAHQAIHHALREIYFVAKRFASDPRVAALLEEGLLKLGGSQGRNEGLPAGVRAAFRPPRGKTPFIAGATVYAARNISKEAMGARIFDSVFFDEAGQASLVLALGARLLGKKTVFIGDDRQLPPVVHSQDGEEDRFSLRSALGHVREFYGAPPLLRETRRLSEPLCAVVGDLFYDGLLSPTPEAKARRFSLRAQPRPEFARIFDPDASLVFIDVPHAERKSLCEEEARWAAALVGEAVRLGLSAEEIAVISPYRAQCNRIRFLCGARRGLVVSTVERFQGQEREIAVISLTSSHLGYMGRMAGFLFNPNRLNVAVSRARTKVVILGSGKALREASERSDESGSDSPAAAGISALSRILACSELVSGARLPEQEPEEARAAAPVEEGFEPGDSVEHSRFGAGVVSAKLQDVVDGRLEWVNEIRFDDGSTRLVIARLADPPMRKLR